MIEYSLAYQFRKRGHWHVQDRKYIDLKEAKADLSVESDMSIHGPMWAKNWRIVKREVGRWTFVEEEK